MKMDFVVGMGRNERIDEVAGMAKVAEESGFKYLTFMDQTATSRDVYAMMTLAALSTKRILIGHGVTDPVTFHPSVTANATATINELSGGRAFIGIGAGGAFGKTMKPQPLRDLREAVEFFKKYTSGEEAEWKGARMHSEWIRRPLPVYLASSGPKSLQMMGELSDAISGIILVSDANLTVNKWRMELIEKGALKAGVDPSKIDAWVRGMIYITDSKEVAKREVSGYAVNSAQFLYRNLLRGGPEIADLAQRLEREEPGLIDDCKRVFEAYDDTQLEKVDTPASKLITQRIIDAQHMVGTPEEICERIYKLQQIGVKTYGTAMYTIFDKKGMMREVGDKIMPHFRN